tara:strand:+ start:45 stop:329 length:285 start_codon:yes stop_codon:yes gene_type:complete
MSKDDKTGKKKKKSVVDRRKDSSKNKTIGGMHTQGSDENIPNEDRSSTGRVYDGIILPPDTQMPFEAWLEVVAHRNFVEELRTWLGSIKITLGN